MQRRPHSCSELTAAFNTKRESTLTPIRTHVGFYTSESGIDDDNGLGAEAGFGVTVGYYQNPDSLAGRGTMYSFDFADDFGLNAQANFDTSGSFVGPSFGPSFGFGAGIFHWQNDTHLSPVASSCPPHAPRGYALL